ncbi:MAG TPA: potassium transporter Kup [Candidatus Sulfotelmatobacter sp.]|nr:potassium transporter Kup [Candidatus Sulfotelmatobacter sp.]
MTAASAHSAKASSRQTLILGALGVVYGDIGTSPLYTVKQCFEGMGGVSRPTIYGVLSLISWALFIVVTLKYVMVMMKADNRGEGGILALTALALRSTEPHRRRYRLALMAGLLGAALFYGDGVITPAISVLSAVEGLKVATPLFEPYVIPLTIGLLVGLFLMQRHGTAHVGRLFGPVTALWFVVIALLGLAEVVNQPEILLALNPFYGLSLLAADPWHGFILLGAVVLAVTGAEALYADMGHFGRKPIRAAWLGCVFPALLLNYFGQGALLLHSPAALENPFYKLAPEWLLYPLVVLAGAATIIASQAVISGAFSMTQQAVQLGYLPRFNIRHTSAEEIGQIFVPQINLLLAAAVIALVLGFQSSDNLGAAYGIAVTGTMSLTTVLAFIYRSRSPDWKPLRALALFGSFLAVDLAFFSANLTKIAQGGWFPLAVATAMFFVMTTWMRGREDLLAQRWRNALNLGSFLDRLKPDHPPRVPGTAVFMAPNLDIVPTALLHNLKHNKVLHDRVVLMKVATNDIPHVADENRLEIGHLTHNFHTVTVHYGFMDAPNIPRALAQCRLQQFHFNLMETSFFIGREKIVIGKRARFRQWRKRLFILMYSTMLSATEFFRIPTNRVVELGGQIEL